MTGDKESKITHSHTQANTQLYTTYIYCEFIYHCTCTCFHFNFNSKFSLWLIEWQLKAITITSERPKRRRRTRLGKGDRRNGASRSTVSSQQWQRYGTVQSSLLVRLLLSRHLFLSLWTHLIQISHRFFSSFTPSSSSSCSSWNLFVSPDFFGTPNWNWNATVCSI